MPNQSRAGYTPIRHSSSPLPQHTEPGRRLSATPWDSDDEDDTVPLAELLHQPIWTDCFDAPRQMYRRTFRKLPAPLRRPLQYLVLALVTLLLLATTFVQHATQKAIYSEVLAEARNSAGWQEFTATTPAPLNVLERVPSESVLDTECLDEWISTGELCARAEGAFSGMDKIDVVFAWTNGTDALQNEWRAAIGPPINTKTARHFREHDELRYSIRAMIAAFGADKINSIKLVTSDFPLDRAPPESLAEMGNASERVEASRHIGQMPHWFDPDAELSEGYPRLELVHHSNVFTNASQLPVFNSLPIEASLQNMDVLPISQYQNDDFLIGIRDQHLTISDIGSPLLGPMLRIDRHFLFQSKSPEQQSEGDQEGEWWSLTRGNWLLSRRFGLRKRGYLNHVPKSFPRALIREAAMHFEEALDTTRESRFRGSSLEFQPFFIWNHYIVEKHREAMLWSYFVARSDANHDGLISADEANAILTDLGLSLTEEGSRVPGYIPRRSTLASLPRILDFAGLPRPLSTNYEYSSHDGYLMTGAESDDPDQKLWPIVPLRDGEEPNPMGDSHKEWRIKPACNLTRIRCFPEGFGEAGQEFNTSEVFRRIAFEEPTCGDCAIFILQGKSAKGLEQFLPPKEELTPTDTEDESVVEPFALGEEDYANISFLPTPSMLTNIRRTAVRMINRYSYTIGSSSMAFIMFRNLHDSILSLGQLNDEFSEAHQGMEKVQGSKSPVWTTMNDDLPDVGETEEFDKILHEFFEMEWPVPSEFERSAGGASSA